MIGKLLKLQNKPRVSQFTAVSIVRGEIKEKVILEGQGLEKPIDISETHTPLCLYPLIIGAIINPVVISKKKRFTITIFHYKSSGNNRMMYETELLAKVNLVFFDLIEIEKNKAVLLLKVKNSRIYQPDLQERYMHTIFLYFHFLRMKKKKSFSFLKNMMAIYLYPRKTILNIIKTTSHYNIFPMDFICESENEEVILLGLNCKNRSLNLIIKTKKMLIIEIDSASKDMAYKFAGNHKEEMPKPGYTANNKSMSEKFNFPFPEFAISYTEISCRKYLKLGSHFLLICDVINKTDLKPQIPLLCHISSVHQSYKEKQSQLYQTV